MGTSRGNGKYIETPERMWELFLAYVKEVKSNPRKKVVFVMTELDNLQLLSSGREIAKKSFSDSLLYIVILPSLYCTAIILPSSLLEIAKIGLEFICSFTNESVYIFPFSILKILLLLLEITRITGSP